MTISLSIFLYLYLGLLVLFFVFSFFNVYHMIRFSFWGFVAFFVTFLFLAITTIILFLSFQEIKQINWQRSYTLDINLFENFNLGEDNKVEEELENNFFNE